MSESLLSKSHKDGFIWPLTDKLAMTSLRGLVLLHWLQYYTGLSDGNGVRGSRGRREDWKNWIPIEAFSQKKKYTPHKMGEILLCVNARPITMASPTNFSTRICRSINKTKMSPYIRLAQTDNKEALNISNSKKRA